MSLSNNYPTTRPSLTLDFANTNMLDPRITFTRSSIATVTNSLGLLQTVQANVPRFDYDPVTLAAKGLLIEAAVTNLLTYSEYFDNAYWQTASNVTVDANQIVAPDGTLTADLLREAATTAPHRLSANTNLAVPGATTSTPNVLSCYFKAGGGVSVPRLSLADTSGTNQCSAFFNLSTVSVTSVVTGGATVNSTSITPIGNGWYRCVLVATITGGTGGIFAYIALGQGTTVSYEGSTSNFVYVWGAQLEAGSFATSYVPSTQTFTGRTSTGTFIGSNGLIQTAGVGVARMQYNPTNLNAQPFLLLEAAATNLYIYSEDFANANWVKSGTTTIVANTDIAPDGTTTADRLVVGTGLAAYRVQQNFAYTTGVTYTHTCYVKKSSYRYAFMYGGGAAIAGDIAILDLDTGLFTLNQNNRGSVTPLTNGWYRLVYTATASASATEGLRIGFTDSPSTVDVTGNGASGGLLWGAQLEAGSFPTSYIPTVATSVPRSADTSTSATTQRNADNASMTGTAFSSWYNAVEGTLFAEYTPYVVIADSRFASIDDGTTASRMMIWGTSSSTRTIFNVRTVNVDQQTLQATGTFTTNTTKTAGAYKANDFAFSVNGAAASTGTSGSIPAVTQLNIGGAGGATPKIHGYIRKIAYYPVRLSNTNLQALTL